MRGKHEFPAIDANRAVCARRQLGRGWLRRPGRAEGGGHRRHHELGRTLGSHDPDRVVSLYTTDGVLWGTLSPTLRADRAALRDYFVTAFKVLPGLKVTFGKQFIRVYGSTAVNTGYYSFSYIKDGQPKTLPARYSFTFVKEGEKWLIVDHHSSAMPAPSR
jgi:uncharacterized protein (TIGR02246 family)